MEQQFTKWVTTWGNAMSIAERRPENYAKDLTLRYPVKMMLEGGGLRITLDNFCGTEPVVLTGATVAKSDGDDGIDKASLQPITFSGSETITIPIGGTIVSDPVAFSVRPGDDVAVSLYFQDFTELRSAVQITGPLSKGYFAVGDHTAAEKMPLELSKKTNWFYFLSCVEVLTTEEKRAVVCYGDSITAQSWPDYLALRTLKEGDGSTAIVRKAASGTRILRQYDNITYNSYGLKGSVRFPREVLVTGADTVIIQHGINDIIHPVGTEVNPFRPWNDLPSVLELIDGLRMYLNIAKQYGMKAYLGTLLPIEGWRTYAPFREELRRGVNEWMRMAEEADGCIDFDQALRNSHRPTAFAKGYDSGDHLHPSESAYQRMAAEVPLEIIRRKS